VTASLAYRKNEAAILRGDIPQKYSRIVPFVPGNRILEIGSAEGVLAMLLSRAGKAVAALEKNQSRVDAAEHLYAAWRQRWDFQSPAFFRGSIADRFDLLEGIDTLVAVRVIYYFGDKIDDIFAEIAKQVPNVVLCGNRNRAIRYHAGTPDQPLGEMNYYASAEGMRDLLHRHGYGIAREKLDGDAIVVGQRF
jgi:hypothetical protein